MSKKRLKKGNPDGMGMNNFMQGNLFSKKI